MDGDAHAEDLFKALGLNMHSLEEGGYTTAGGWALEALQHIPQAGESFCWRQYRVTIQSMDEQRIAFLTVERTPDAPVPG